ncbi:MAG: YdhR family protein [Candidatus Latescibacterota bacterium]|nr:YdhR family protein [Candidatus Latescibacterota bacterium]
MKANLSKLSILVVNYKYDLREDNDLVEATKDGEAAKVFRDFPGLGIKFGLANPEDNEYGGVYIFQDDASLEAYIESPILKEWAANPDVSELTYKRYNTLPDFTKNTIKPNYMIGDFINDLNPVSELVNN